MDEIIIQATTWQIRQKGLTMLIKPFPAEFEDYNIKERNAEEERNWFVEEVKTEKTIHYSIHHNFLDLVGFISAKNILNKSCNIEIEILDYTNFNKGFGKMAFQQFVNILKEKNIESIFALIHPNNKRAISFFEQLKFNYLQDELSKENFNYKKYFKKII